MKLYDGPSGRPLPPNFTSLPLEGAWKASSGNMQEHSNIMPVENLIPLAKHTIPIEFN